MLYMISDRLMYSDVSLDFFEVNNEVKDLVSRRQEDIRKREHDRMAGCITTRHCSMEGFYCKHEAPVLG